MESSSKEKHVEWLNMLFVKRDYFEEFKNGKKKNTRSLVPT